MGMHKKISLFIFAAIAILGIGCVDNSQDPGNAYNVRFSDNLIHESGVYNDEISIDLYSDNASGEAAPLTVEEIGHVVSVLYDTTQEPDFIEFSADINKDRLFRQIYVVVTDNPRVANQLYWYGISPQFIPDEDDPGHQVLDIAAGFYKPNTKSYTIFVSNISLHKNPNATPAEVMTGLIIHEVTHAIVSQIGHNYPGFNGYKHENPLFWTDLRLWTQANLAEEDYP